MTEKLISEYKRQGYLGSSIVILKCANMKQFLVIAVLVAVASARPRYLMVPIEDVEFIGDAMDGQAIPIIPMFNSRMGRQLEAENLELQPPPSQRRQGGAPAAAGGPSESFINTIRGAGIALGDDQLEGASSLHAAPSGPDYVDYGAYTGKGGAFGWYTDHPVLTYHRR
ncbi:hypothetical protein TCAL_00043 [Tigriopus californicus]|uniref:Uncharacterized protein n=1 Tax=Tigriopus californicus TaxID=6832 RepID=A0A553PHE8_TIGCA|nr:uncharacterized protein LOC131880661 [Tigriopus californicus]TRY77111.1 hypothetical protein TCAL_00043 [Tigriopus californicus]